MDEKQKLIMDVAQEYFNRKGLQSTSIDEIVKVCKISKATFYKYFSTKEDLAKEIFSYSSKKLLSSAKAIDNNLEIDDKERLKKKIILIWEYILYDSHLNREIIENFSEDKSKSISKLKKMKKNVILDEYCKSLIIVYGEEIKSIVWELIFLMDSLIHEFVLIMRIKNEKFEPDFVGDYVIRMIDITIEKLKGIKPMIDKSVIYCLEDNVDDNLYSSEKALFLETIKKLKELIQKDAALVRQNKLIEATNKLEQEAKAGLYDSLMMDALLSFLEKEKALKAEVSILNNLKNKLGDDVE
ncbi:TetR/AcrR family transcriptional regulator [Clostridium sp. 2-1]|uniref:TetR/AcrR family transcriptional regulator n=1 Tax=Clostridium TaxID=1485 RepID=UPI000CDA09EE|nr:MULTISPECIES: TetR/AcrR family transcriptional regulator [Clostridium]MBN7577023.1 TetR/AcrR family transcriptional regulator [Clostridium beijerinckii]MBN7580150.1 TetR/AcrR family transcriptional regulator [Clostridium beijerinckii]MBN7586804.1 TetR/AcrR family transcriptional regulator [Clostridium beijerinckii]MBO0523008.1 TetR/AcrR family transcriptional regulator [Clostridium beijerinckii]POO89156.1 TetR/AcrR family transcriptional regulator [Clostridium sp. 2-1]